MSEDQSGYPKEIVIAIKGDESSYRQKFLVYESCKAAPDDHVVLECIRQTREHYKGEIEKISVKISMVIL